MEEVLNPELRMHHSAPLLAPACDTVGLYEPEIGHGDEDGRRSTVPFLKGKITVAAGDLSRVPPAGTATCQSLSTDILFYSSFSFLRVSSMSSWVGGLEVSM